jgi:protein O-mannosyl-transferase
VTKSHRSGRRGVPSAPLAAAARTPPALWWCTAIIVAAGILTYVNSLSGAFILDDQSTIVDNQQIREWWRLSSVLSPESNTAIAGRPVVNLSFAVNYALGGLDVRGYHAGNIAIHIICALLAFGILRRTLELPRLRDRFGTNAVWLSCAAALLWVVHPLNSEVVNYLTERTESLMALFFLLTMYASIRALDLSGAETRSSQNRKGARTHGRWRALAIVACGLGMACKESMVTAPVLVVLYDRVFVFETFRDALRQRRGLYLGLGGTWLVLVALMQSGPRSAVGGFSTGISPWTYLLNQTHMISHYLRLSFWPRSLVVFYGWPAALTLRDVLPYALFISLLLLATIAALVRLPAAGFLGAWFFITLAPTSSIVPIATEVGAERRMYLPLLAVVTLVVAGLSAGWQRWLVSRPSSPHGLNFRVMRVARMSAVAVLALASIALALGTIVRNREYASALTIARTVVERRPSAVTHHYLAEQLAQANLHEEARQHLREAVAGGDSRARYLLGIELFNAGKLNESMEQLYAFVATAKLPYRLVPHWLEPPAAEVLTARLVLARTAAMQGAWSRSAEQARLVLAAAPGNRDARMFLADSLFAQQQYEQAGAEYSKYLELDPASTHALVNLGITLVAAGKIEEALPKFRRAVEVEPRNVNARRVLATALLDSGDVQGAEAQAREAVALSPKDPALNELFARASAAARTRGRQ